MFCIKLLPGRHAIIKLLPGRHGIITTFDLLTFHRFRNAIFSKMLKNIKGVVQRIKKIYSTRNPGLE